jgi:hypothetical protein
VRRQEVEVGERRSSSSRRCPAVVVVSSGDQLARAALPEPGPVPPVDVHVAPQSLRRPELPPAVAAGVRGRRRWWHRPRGEATGGQAEVVTRRPRRRLLLLEAAAVVVPLHCWGGGVVWLSYSSLSYTSEMEEPDEQSKQRHTHMVSTKAAVSIYNLRAGNANSAGSAHFTLLFARHVGVGLLSGEQRSLQSKKQQAAAQVLRVFFDEQYRVLVRQIEHLACVLRPQCNTT